MSNRKIAKRKSIRHTLMTEPMVERDVGHICTYIVDEEDRNFKVCIYCGHTAYRTNEELLGDYQTLIERGLGGD